MSLFVADVAFNLTYVSFSLLLVFLGAGGTDISCRGVVGREVASLATLV